MKTAEEWSKEFNTEYNKLDKEADEKIGEGVVPQEHILEIIIKQIQLDAWKQGMSDAANMAGELEPSGELKIQETIHKHADIISNIEDREYL